jgi:hypothetical protein
VNAVMLPEPESTMQGYSKKVTCMSSRVKEIELGLLRVKLMVYPLRLAVRTEAVRSDLN